MAKLSRTLKYQDLRDKIDEETSITPSKSEITAENNETKEQAEPTHANRPLHPHEEVRVRPNTITNTGRNPLMDDVLDEVKQYNIEKGTRYSTDTQINILKQFEDSNFEKRNQHIMPMEEDTELAGSTMQIPVTQNEDGISAYLPNQKLTRMNPITLDRHEEEVKPAPAAEPEVSEDTIETPKIETTVAPVFDEDTSEFEEIDSTTLIRETTMPVINADDHADTDNITIMSAPSAGSFISYSDEVKFLDEDEEEIDYSRPRKAKLGRKKNKVRSEKPVDTTDMPSAKIRMVASDMETVEHQPRSKGSIIVNVLLVVMILLLIAAIIFVVTLFRSLAG